MTDIAPELLEKVQERFEAETAGLREEIKSGVKSYEEAYDYAIKVGEALSRSFGVNITPEVLPDGMMYYNIADKVVRPMLMTEYNLTSEAAVSAQRSVNKAAGIGIRPLKAEFDAEKAQGIIDRVSSQPFEEIKWILNEPVKTFSKNVVDQTIKKNVEFQGKSGLHPKIVRRASAGACQWCQEVAGTYEYPDVPDDVYRRHANCDCTTEYVSGGKYQDVWTKVEYKSKAERDAEIQRRVEAAQSQIDQKIQTGRKLVGGHYYKVDPEAPMKERKAARAYEKYSRVDDSVRIANNTGFTVEQIQSVRSHIFFEKHDLYEGYDRFAPDYDMAVAWKRLREGNYLPRDITLLNHELLERQIEGEYNLNAEEAHAKASEVYDWGSQIDEETDQKGEADGLL